jgi:peptidoglycan/LPS O-acetylase OafA/YrhL
LQNKIYFLQEYFMNRSFFEKRKGVFLTLAFLLLAAAAAMAQELLPSQMEGLMAQIQAIFLGGFVRGVLICSLAGCAVAYGFNKDNEKMKRNVIAIAVACAILIAAQSIIENVVRAAGGSVS